MAFTAKNSSQGIDTKIQLNKIYVKEIIKWKEKSSNNSFDQTIAELSPLMERHIIKYKKNIEFTQNMYKKNKKLKTCKYYNPC